MSEMIEINKELLTEIVEILEYISLNTHYHNGVLCISEKYLDKLDSFLEKYKEEVQ